MSEICGARCGCPEHRDTDMTCELEKDHAGPHESGLNRWLHKPLVFPGHVDAAGWPLRDAPDA